MTTWIGLLRGVNVGGKNKLPMADLRRIAASCGHAGVRTYIQSGNLVFEAKGKEKNGARLGDELRAAIASETKVDCAVILRTAAELAATIAQNPFADDPGHVHVVFLAQPPKVGFEDAEYAPERLAIVGREIYLYLPDGVGRSKLAADVGRAKALAGTARNWRTVEKLLALATTP